MLPREIHLFQGERELQDSRSAIVMHQKAHAGKLSRMTQTAARVASISHCSVFNTKATTTQLLTASIHAWTGPNPRVSETNGANVNIGFAQKLSDQAKHTDQNWHWHDQDSWRQVRSTRCLRDASAHWWCQKSHWQPAMRKMLWPRVGAGASLAFFVFSVGRHASQISRRRAHRTSNVLSGVFPSR